MPSNNATNRLRHAAPRAALILTGASGKEERFIQARRVMMDCGRDIVNLVNAAPFLTIVKQGFTAKVAVVE
jgi:hypothetical protein